MRTRTGDNILTALSVARECHMVPAGDRVVIVSATRDPSATQLPGAQPPQTVPNGTSGAAPNLLNPSTEIQVHYKSETGEPLQYNPDASAFFSCVFSFLHTFIFICFLKLPYRSLNL